MKKLLKKFLSDESGLESVEYAVVGGLVLVLAIAVISGLGDEVSRVFGLMRDRLATVTG